MPRLDSRLHVLNLPQYLLTMLDLRYFLITPKLLTGLTYHPKMKVLIINNGIFC